jgi:pimeloyl-ACP methyl ester carboxylesterase
MPTRPINATTLHFKESGTGPPLVLLHGFPLDSRVWNHQRSGLSDAFRVITPDLRGFGKSASADPFTMESLADDVHALLRELKALPAFVGGLSMGGYAALAYAKRYPTDLRGLLLIDTRAEGDSPQGKEGRGKMIELVRQSGAAAVAEQMMPKMLAPGASEDVKRELKSIMESCLPLTIEHALLAMRDRADHTCDLPSIASPTLILVGESDAITPPASAEVMHKAIPHSQLVVIPAAGHMTPMESPHAVNAAIRAFALKKAS